MDDPYLEETIARITVSLREQVRQLQAGDDPHPVIFYATANHELGQRVLAHLGYVDLEPDQPTPLTVLTRARVRTLLNKQVRAGIGTLLMGMPMTVPDSFILLAVLRDHIDLHQCGIEGGRICSGANIQLPYALREVRIRGKNGEWVTMT